MAGILISLALALGMSVAIWALFRPRRIKAEPPPVPGQLTAAERRQLYARLGIDPAAMARRGNTNVIWLDPRRAGQPRTDA